MFRTRVTLEILKVRIADGRNEHIAAACRRLDLQLETGDSKACLLAVVLPLDRASCLIPELGSLAANRSVPTIVKTPVPRRPVRLPLAISSHFRISYGLCPVAARQ